MLKNATEVKLLLAAIVASFTTSVTTAVSAEQAIAAPAPVSVAGSQAGTASTMPVDNSIAAPLASVASGSADPVSVGASDLPSAANPLPAGLAPIDTAEKAGGYRIHPGDRIRVQFFQRDQISGEFEVRPDGTISLALIGAVKVSGYTTGEIETIVSREFHRATQRAAHVSVQTVSGRPVFVVGDVNTPGSIAFSSGMTPLQAIALTGGLYRLAVDTNTAFEATREQWKLRTSAQDMAKALTKLARLEAQSLRGDAIPTDARVGKLVSAETATQLLSFERRVLQQNALWLKAEEERRTALVERSQAEVNALKSRIKLIEEEQADHVAELRDTEDLMTRGLTTRTRYYAKKYTLSSLRQSESSVRAEIARAEKDLADAEESLNSVWQTHRKELAEQIRATQDEINRHEMDLRASGDMLRNVGGEHLIQTSIAGRPRAQPIYEVMRRDQAGGYATILVEETAELRPGDVLRVSLAPQAVPAAQQFDAGVLTAPNETQEIPASNPNGNHSAPVPADGPSIRVPIALKSAEPAPLAAAPLTVDTTPSNELEKVLAKLDDMKASMDDERSQWKRKFEQSEADTKALLEIVRTLNHDLRQAQKQPPLLNTQNNLAAAVQATGAELVRLTQQELKRLGCLSDRIDGFWGPKSRAALAGYNEAKGTAFETAVPPDQQLLVSLQRTESSVCTRQLAGM